VVAKEGIAATDEELDREIEQYAERSGEKPEKVRREFEQRGVLEAVRSDIARGKAVQFLVDHATVVDEAGQPVDLTLPDGSSAEETESESKSEQSEQNEQAEEPSE
jgi:trigger factor